MKNLFRKIAITLTLVMTFALCFAFVGCGDDDEQTDFRFTEETLVKINDKEFSDTLVKYCNDFYKHFQVECEQKLYIENANISSKKGNEILDKVNEIAKPYLLSGNEDKAREILKYYSPFYTLGSIRAQEYLNIKYDWVWVDGELKPTNPSPLTQKYINDVNEQFEILKESYFKK